MRSEIGLPANRTNSILQAAFFALTKVIPLDVAVEDMKKNNYNSYFKKAGQNIVDRTTTRWTRRERRRQGRDPRELGKCRLDAPAAGDQGTTPFVKEIVLPMDRQQGDKLPVSVFQKHGVLDGTWENGTSVYSKRGVATKVPKWDGTHVSSVTAARHELPARRHPSGTPDRGGEGTRFPLPSRPYPQRVWARTSPTYSYRMQISPYDCLGCGVCLTACPANNEGMR